MTEKFEGYYEVEDGYVGKSRPVYFSVHESDIDEDMDEEDLRNLYDKEAKDHFEKNIYYAVSREDQFVEWAKEVIDAGEEGQ
jgi:hypothetical protein